MIKYIAYYGNGNCIEKRNYFLSATSKIDYIAHAIAKNEREIEIISTSESIKEKGRRYKIYTNRGIPVIMLKSNSGKYLINRIFNRLFIKIQMIIELLINTRKTDIVIVYHSLAYLNVIRLLKKIKRFKLILEVEEIYGDVLESERVRKHEKSFFQIADSYIFPTQLLDQEINVKNKPSVVIHGTYQVEEDKKNKIHDEHIHIVYAGTLDFRKGGAAAAAAAEFLNNKYHIHIIGFGSDNDKRFLLDTIDRVSKRNKCVITYDGLRIGTDYVDFLQSCDIGLSTQNPDAAFNNTSFPSKIISYMANGLRVVSIRIPAIEASAIGNYMYYYDEQTPEEIAEAIKRVDIKETYNSRAIIQGLHEKFIKDMKGMLENL